MAYFTAVLTGADGAWRSVDADIDDVTDVDDLAEEVGEAAEGPVLVVLEREDEWFALVRADGAEPRTFVSDLTAVQSSRYAELLSAAADAPAAPPADADDSEDAAASVAAPSWAGDAGLLADLGVSAEELASAAESHDPAGALVVVGERCGFVDLLEALR